MAGIKNIMPQHHKVSLLSQYLPSQQAGTTAEVNQRSVSFLFLFHSSIRVSQREVLEVQNEMK